jgi:hypothetical protein
VGGAGVAAAGDGGVVSDRAGADRGIEGDGGGLIGAVVGAERVDAGAGRKELAAADGNG